MSDERTALARFLISAEQIKKLTDMESYGAIRSARGLPGEYANQASRIEVLASHYGRMTEQQKATADRLKNRLIVEERERGERERSALLRKYSSLLEALRAELPALAASAAIEIGIIARSLAKESEGSLSDGN